MFALLWCRCISDVDTACCQAAHGWPPLCSSRATEYSCFFHPDHSHCNIIINMADAQPSTSSSSSPQSATSKGKRPEITAEISPSDAYLLALKVSACLWKFDDRAAYSEPSSPYCNLGQQELTCDCDLVIDNLNSKLTSRRMCRI